MKWVRLEGNIVREIIPDAATIPSVAHWYGEDFAALCREAPDNVACGWICDKGTGVFSEPPGDDIEEVRRATLERIGAQCNAAIYAGVEVGGYHYSLVENEEKHDQLEIMAQLDAVKSGAPFVPYHADGELCRMFPAAEFAEIAQAATAHIFYHRTYCNHLNAWIRRAETIAELGGITYGAELPADLAASMAALMSAAGGSA